MLTDPTNRMLYIHDISSQYYVRGRSDVIYHCVLDDRLHLVYFSCFKYSKDDTYSPIMV